MQVISVATESFTGDLLAVGLQNCFLEGEPSGLTGIDLWDVSDPSSPSRLGFFDVAPTDGADEISLTKQVVGDGGSSRSRRSRSRRWSPVSPSDPMMPSAISSGRDHRSGQPDADRRLGCRQGRQLPFGSPLFGLPAPFDCSPATGQPDLCRGHFPAVFAHSTSPTADGTRSYVAYWDADGIVLDISTPQDVQFIGRTLYPAGREGDTHPAVEQRHARSSSPPTRTSAPASARPPASRRWSLTPGASLAPHQESRPTRSRAVRTLPPAGRHRTPR